MKKEYIKYNENIYDEIKENIIKENYYSDTEKKILIEMLFEIKEKDMYLNMVQIFPENKFDMEIENYKKYQGYMVKEVYKALINQALDSFREYEDVFYEDVRSWINGLTINIEVLIYIDKLFKDNGITIIY